MPSGRAPPQARGPLLPGVLLGFGLGGFFDGILLHQILQWHHLLSLVEGAILRDLHTQILPDGAFHAVMYLVAGSGLCVLDLPEPRRAWRLCGQGALLVGGPGLPASCLGWSPA